MIENLDQSEGELKELTNCLRAELEHLCDEYDDLYLILERYEDLCTQLRELRERLKI